MNTQAEALQMAIEQIKWAEHLHDWHDGLLDALKACKEALAQPAQEHIGYYYPDERMACLLFKKGLEIPRDALPLYGSPTPSWQGLSDDERKNLWKDYDLSVYEYGIAIEQALKEKNT